MGGAHNYGHGSILLWMWLGFVSGVLYCLVNIIVVGLGVVERDRNCGCDSILFWV